LVELRENEAKVLKTLQELGGKASSANIVEKSQLADSAVARAILTLSNQGLVRQEIVRLTELRPTEEGKVCVERGLPERRVVDQFKPGDEMPIAAAVKNAGLGPEFIPIVTGWLSRKKWGTLEKKDGIVQVRVDEKPAKDPDEKLVEKVGLAGVLLEELPEDLQASAQRLLKRSILEAKPRNDHLVEITGPGVQALPTLDALREVSSLTGEMITSGEWAQVKLRSYNVSSQVPPLRPGKYHPYLRFLRMVRRKLVALGFQEAVGPLVEPTFINADCLYMPQDHPAREIHDLYYLKDPSSMSLAQWGATVDKVAKTHENGWKTGSTGWGYKYSREEASKLILRSHGTAVSVRTMLSKDLRIPGKYFAIARCFRPDVLDRTHLIEFNQVEGIVLDEKLNLRNLLGVLEMFAKEVAGADRVRFKPDYFPFTEPSVELQAYKSGFGWIEFGGSGIFRPEVTEPLGVNVPVLAWGLGIDRLYMMHKGIQDIRQIFTTDLDWIREQKVE
jgi:phenylalanyl-tRNA synthetase alpha chain